MLRVEIESDSKAEKRSGTTASGKDWVMYQQPIRLFKPHQKSSDSFILILHESVKEGYKPGYYILDIPSLITRGSFDSFQLVRGFVLIPYTSANIKKLISGYSGDFKRFDIYIKNQNIIDDQIKNALKTAPF